jgi:hypothetical protein
MSDANALPSTTPIGARGAFAVGPSKNVRCAMLFEQLRKQSLGRCPQKRYRDL